MFKHAIDNITILQEMFVEHLTKNAYQNMEGGNTLRYQDLAKYVQEGPNLEFLL